MIQHPVEQLAAAAGVRLRAFAGASDFPAMLRVANATSTADGVEVIRTLESITRDYAALRDSDPLDDVVIAEASGEVVAYARSMRWTQQDGLMLFGQLGFVPPQWRRRGIGRTLLAWLEQRQRAVALQHPEAAAYAHHAYTTESESDRPHARLHGVHLGRRRWRRRGVARALVVLALRVQRDAGMLDSALGVDSKNADRAAAIYEACGFREVRRSTTWRKPFKVEARTGNLLGAGRRC